VQSPGGSCKGGSTCLGGHRGLGPHSAQAAESLEEESLAEAQPLTRGTLHARNGAPGPPPAVVPASTGAGQQQAEGK